MGRYLCKRLPKTAEEYLVSARFTRGSVIIPVVFLLYMNDLCDAICNIDPNVDSTSIFSKRDRASDL